ncbi:MAG: DUF58 domain-containing protein [Planctomycetota bacterium]|nr:DUF58 domain-containing protein [Planctomycetota bacterium]
MATRPTNSSPSWRRRLRPGGGDADSMLPADLERRAGHLVVAARTLVEGLMHGRHRTPHRGAGSEFYDFRAYVPGDSPRSIDWKVYARSDRLYVRRRTHEAQLSVTIVVDASPSMAFAALPREVRRRRSIREQPESKFARARAVAAAIAYLATRQADRAGLIVTGVAAGPRVIPCAAGWPHFFQIAAALEAAHAAETGSAADASLSVAVDAAVRASPQRGIVFILSDALDEPAALLDSIARLRFAPAGRGRDVALLQLLTPDELDLEPLDAARLIDPETRVASSARGDDVAAGYRAAIAGHIESIRKAVEGMGARHVLASTSDDAVETLRRLLAG